MGRWLVLALLSAAVAGGFYYKYMYTPHLLREATERALADFTAAVKAQDRARVGEVLSAHLAEDAKIHMQVGFLSLTQRGSKPVEEDFTKKEFITFIDNVLYPLDAYDYQPELAEFELRPDRTEADVVFSSKEWADGKSYYGGVAVNMRYSSDTECQAHVSFLKMSPLIHTASCTLTLRAVPKPEEAHKISNNPQALQQLLMR